MVLMLQNGELQLSEHDIQARAGRPFRESHERPLTQTVSLSRLIQGSTHIFLHLARGLHLFTSHVSSFHISSGRCIVASRDYYYSVDSSFSSILLKIWDDDLLAWNPASHKLYGRPEMGDPLRDSFEIPGFPYCKVSVNKSKTSVLIRGYARSCVSRRASIVTVFRGWKQLPIVCIYSHPSFYIVSRHTLPLFFHGILNILLSFVCRKSLW